MRGDSPWVRYINLLDWDEEEIQSEPRILSEAETEELAASVLPMTPDGPRSRRADLRAAIRRYNRRYRLR